MSVQAGQGMALLTSIFALTGFILNWFAVVSCNFVDLALTYGSQVNPDYISMHFGLWSYLSWTVVSSIGGSVIFQGCWHYPESMEFGDAMKAARACSIIALIIALGFAFADCITSCTSGRRAVSPMVQGIGYMVTSIFSGLSLLVLHSDVCTSNDLVDDLEKAFPNADFNVAKCNIATGAKCAIAGTAFYFLAGAAACYGSKVEKADAKKVGGAENEGLDEPLVQE